MNRIFYILVICCQAFGVSAQSVADAGLFTYSAAGTVTASLGRQRGLPGDRMLLLCSGIRHRGPWLMRRFIAGLCGFFLDAGMGFGGSALDT